MSVKAIEPDPVSANNTAMQTADVVPVFKLTVTKTGNGLGTVTSDPGGSINCGSVCSATYRSGTIVNVSKSPDATSVLAGWSGSCTGIGACAVAMTADQTVAANFVLGEKLSVVLAGGGSDSVTGKDGAINCTNSGGICSSLYVPRTSVSLTAAPAGTSVFGGWSGACTGTDPSLCNLNLNSNQTVTATFSPPTELL
jgi:endoglucanase